MPVIDSSGSNPATAATRSKARRAKLVDETRMRQLLQMSPSQLVTGIADCGYRNEIDTYAMRLSGSDLVEASLNHNLSRELSEVTGYCQSTLKIQVKVFNDRDCIAVFFYTTNSCVFLSQRYCTVPFNHKGRCVETC